MRTIEQDKRLIAFCDAAINTLIDEALKTARPLPSLDLCAVNEARKHLTAVRELARRRWERTANAPD